MNTWYTLLKLLTGQSNANTGPCPLPYFSCFFHLPHIRGYDAGLLIAHEAEV